MIEYGWAEVKLHCGCCLLAIAPNGLELHVAHRPLLDENDGGYVWFIHKKPEVGGGWGYDTASSYDPKAGEGHTYREAQWAAQAVENFYRTEKPLCPRPPRMSFAKGSPNAFGIASAELAVRNPDGSYVTLSGKTFAAPELPYASRLSTSSSLPPISDAEIRNFRPPDPPDFTIVDEITPMDYNAWKSLADLGSEGRARIMRKMQEIEDEQIRKMLRRDGDTDAD